MFRPAPRASGYFRTDYGQDLALLQTRTERVSAVLFLLALAAFPFAASPFLLDLACQVFLASIGALALMLLTGYAGQISLGHAGLLAAGAFTTGILAREVSAPFWITLPASALTGMRARPHLRPAVAAAARALSRGQHAGPAFHRHLSRRRIRNQARLLDRHPDRPAEPCRLSSSPTAAPGISCCWPRRP